MADSSKLDNSGQFGNLEKGRRIFINGINSLIGHSLFEELRNDHIAIHTGETPHKFFGTINQKDKETIPVPSQSIKVLNSKSKPRTFKKQIASCDIFILDMMSGNGDSEDVEYIIKTLKQSTEDANNKIQTQKTLVLLSSVMTWINTPKKMKKNFPQPKPEDSDMEEDVKNRKLIRDDESDSEDREEIKRTPQNEKVLYFTDQDYQQRVPPPRYQQIKNIENMAMAAQKAVKNLKVHIICSGLLYGNGESNNVFYEFFRRAWLSLHQELASLPIIGDGKNRIPTIHVTDLARCIRHVIQTKSIKQQYLLAVDCGVRQTQKKILKAISQGMGSGYTRNVDLSEIIDEEWSEYMTLDLKLLTSEVFKNAQFWHCKQGLCKKTMALLNQEFNVYRGLFPLKVLITGPPASGKTHFADHLAKAYGIPHLKIQDLIQMGNKLQDSLGDEIRKKTEEIKDQMIADYDKAKKKKDPELDRNTIKVRLPDEILYKLVQIQMSTAAYRNKGFILDGYPRNMNDAKHIFLTPKENYQEPAEGAPEDESLFPGFEPNTNYLPQYMIVLQGEDAQLKLRVKDLPLEKTQDTHFNDQSMDRRLKVYREHNVHDSGNSVQCFFTKLIGQENTQILNSFDENSQNIEKVQKFIEKNGKPCCLNLITEQDVKFLKSIEKKKKVEQIDKSEDNKQYEQSQVIEEEEEDEDDEDEIKKVIRKEEEESKLREEEEKERKRVEALESEQRKIKEDQDHIKMENIRQQERDLLDTRSQPIRQYLMDNVVPYLTMGLIDLCKQVPQEPGEFLADFLLKKADEIDQKRLQEREAALKAKQDAKALKLQ